MSHPDFRLVNGKLPYGTEYWFSAETTHAEMLADFAQMRAMGMNTLRIFISSSAYSAENKDFCPIDQIFSAAQEKGMTVCPTFSLDLSEWQKQQLGLDPALNIPLAYLLDDPDYRKMLAPGLQDIIRRYAGHPALWSWILWNEPSRRPFYPPPPPVWSGFRQWLETHYAHNIKTLCAAWYPSQNPPRFQSFQAIEPRHIHADWTGLWDGYALGTGYHALVAPIVLRLATRVQAVSWDAFPIWRDWILYNTDALTQSIQWLASLVHEIDPIHPTHINPDGFLQNQSAVSRDFNALSRSVELFGSSLHPGHHFSIIHCEDQMPAAIAYYTQSIASAAREKMGLVTEMQAGPNTWSGNMHFTPDSNDLILWSLTALGCGLKGIIYWLWKPREHGWEAGEWGLLQHNGKNTPRALGASRLGRFFEDHSAWLSELSPQKPVVAILRSPESETLGLIESLYGVQPVDKYQTLSEYGCFRALWRSGIPVEMITPQEAQTGALSAYRCLFIPFAEAMSAETARSIEQFAHAGGWVYAETPLATKDPNGVALPTRPGFGLDEIFAQAIDIWPARKEPLLNTPFGQLHSELFIQPLESSEHEVVAELSDGYDVIVEHNVGKGRTLFAGTCLTLFCGQNLSTPDEDAFLASFALRAGARSWSKGEMQDSTAAYFLAGKDSDAFIVINHGPEETELELALPHNYHSISPLLGRDAPWVSRRILRITLPPRSAEVLRLNR
jgi:hypothetical protein